MSITAIIGGIVTIASTVGLYLRWRMSRRRINLGKNAKKRSREFRKAADDAREGNLESTSDLIDD